MVSIFSAIERPISVMKTLRRFSLFSLLCLTSLVGAQSRTQDVVYMKAGGSAFTMDVVKPEKPNRAAVVFMVSGGWVSDHTMLKSFMPGIEKALTDVGFTVFEVVHGAQPRYKVAEIVEQVRTAFRFAKLHAGEYGVDANRIGVSGISSGGHLSLMIAGSPDCGVDAVAAIAPPTDLVNWGKSSAIVVENPLLEMFAPALEFDLKGSKAAMEEQAKKLSPITLVTAKFPPTLIVHGDDDKVVPLQQGETMDQALGKAGVEHKLEVVKGGGHDEKAFVPGIAMAIEWFRKQLLK